MKRQQKQQNYSSCRYIFIENNTRIGKIPNIKRTRMDLGHSSAPDENKSE